MNLVSSILMRRVRDSIHDYIDLDELEAGSDTSKLEAAESEVKDIETEFVTSSAKLVKQQ